ncbi:MAG TPA: GNAT family N-acetyltransferase [candidate division Zixibacteria bacterium]
MKSEDEVFNVEIRRLKSLVEAETCARIMSDSEPWITLRRDYEDSLKTIQHPSKDVYLALVNNEIKGFIILQMSGVFVGYLQTVAVLPEWRNRGIGSKMIKFAEDRIFKEFPNVFLCVSSFNRKAQELYKRLGYETVGELKDFIVRGHSEILLRKTIGPLIDYNKNK